MDFNNSEIPCEICNSNILFENYIEHVERCFIISASQNYLQHTIQRSIYQQQPPQPIMQTIFQLNNLINEDNDEDNDEDNEINTNSTQILLNSDIFSNSNMFIQLSQSANEIFNILPILLGDNIPNTYEINLQLQEMTGGDVLVPVKRKSEAYSVIEENEIDELSCAICLEKPEDAVFVKTKCNHIYCKTCIDKWFEMNSRCPICKKNFNDSEDDEQEECENNEQEECEDDEQEECEDDEQEECEDESIL